ncbi:MAG: hypothetical protein NT062_01600 [Proteobacteria bacterium]|nr:hypothetical protein [Pseudomonadota bacterium]
MLHALMVMRIAVLAFTLLAGCVTPSIPIPPPDPSLMAFDIDTTSNTARFTYPARDYYVDALAFVYNRETGMGIIEHAHDDGSVGPTAPIAVTLGDQVVVSFQREDQTVSTCIRVRNGAQSATDYCN